jgi:hypothetical protein
MSPRTRLAALAAVSTVLAGSLVACGDDGASPSADPAASEPAASEPAASEPAASEPAASQPAGELHVSDPAGDVVDSGTARKATAPEALTNVDVVAADLDNSQEALSVALTYADLDLGADGQWGLSLGLRTSADSFVRQVDWEQGRYADTGERYEEAGMTRSTPEDALDNPCPGLRVSKDQDAERVTVLVPNRCLGDAEWVRVVSFATDAVPPSGAGHLEDDLTDGSVGRRWPRLYVS